MADMREQTIVGALREETRPLLLVRMRRILYIGISGLVLSAVSDLRFGPQTPYDVILLKLCGALVEAAGAALLARTSRSSWRVTATAAVVAWSLACTVVSVNGSYTADPLMPGLLLPLMVIGAAMVFPWGTAPQIALVAVSSAIFLPHVAALGTNLAVSVYSVFAASIYIAATFDRQQIQRKALELLQAGHHRALERIAADAPLADVFAELLRTVRQQAPDSTCVLMLLDPDTKRLRYADSNGLPDGYGQAIDDAATRTDQRATAPDPPANRRWARPGPLALAHGLSWVWSEPILAADRQMLGVIEVYHREQRVEGVREIEAIEAAARLLGIAIERRDGRLQLERYLQALDGARAKAEEQTEQLQEQAVLLAEARDQALASVRVRSQFLANMSHEIRTPLNGIIGTTDILLDSELSPSQREYARILSQCGQHLLGVISDILDFSKMEAGKVDIERVNVDLRALVEDVAEVLAARAQEKGIELASSIPPEFDVTVKADPSRLRQVLVNLVGNAIKFTEHGEVVIEGRVLCDSATHLTVRLAVRDSGVGIPVERQAAIFESFTQADGSTTRNFGGTGLGLSISRELVHLMGGEIGLQSTPGTGSTFWIALPLERVGAAAAAQRPAPERLAGVRVLVVDDTAINRLILRRSLESWRCRVEEAASGYEALALLQDTKNDDPFGLVILDMQMPQLSGIATARRAKASARLPCPPLVLLSSIGGLRCGEREARDIGLAAVVTKPVRQSALLDALLGALGEAAPDPAPPRPPAAVAPLRRTADLSVLLAEDNPVNQMVARRLLEKLGCRIDVVDNGRDAVEAVARTRYDVVLMDIQMPVMDGFEASARIRGGEAADDRVPIIAMTAHAMQGDRERCLASGMDGYVAKPVNIAALDEVLSGVERRAPAEAAAATRGAASASPADFPPSAPST